MTVPDPATAPARPDLTWLRHRRKAAVAPPAPPPPPPPSPAPAAPRATASLDLGETTLDLGDVVAAPVEEPEPPRRVVPARRVDRGRPQVLTPAEPVVTLTHLQSGIGTITFEAACSAAVGDLHLACAYRLSSGVSSVAMNRDGLSLAPVRSQVPVLRVHRDRFDTVTVDCRRVRDLDRLLLLGFSPSGSALAWGGTLLVTTLGGARVEMPMDGPSSPGAVGLATVYQVDGELVVRAEPRDVLPTVRDTCLAFGFDRITWLDPTTPAV